LDARVRIDFLFAYADRDDEGEPTGFAILVHGVRAYGQCRIVNLRDRAKGNCDTEIVLDHDYWESVCEERQRALLDHELHHILVLANKSGVAKTDDLCRPKLKLRKHDHQFGWFDIVAKRNGEASIERMQAETILESSGQFYWPSLVRK
jgi:hypothetical protein